VRVLSDTPASADLVVIGGGIVGAGTAFWCTRAGIRTLLVEARPALGQFTTAVAAGGYRLQLDHHDELRLVRRSVELFHHFAEETGQTRYDPNVQPQGYLWLTADPGRVEAQRALVDAQRLWAVDGVEHLSGDAARERFPWLSPCVVGARFRAGDGLIDPRTLTMGLAEASDALVVTGWPVERILVSGGRVAGVAGPRGSVAAGSVVVACGPLSAPLLRSAGVELPVRALRRQRLAVWGAPEIPAGAPMTIDEDTTAHWRPTQFGAFGLFPDPAESGGEPHQQVPADPAFALRLLDPASDVALARTAPFWADVWERNTAQWVVQAGEYTMTPDQRPLIGPGPVDGLWINTGYSGHGVMASPAGSELLAGLLSGAASPAENPFPLDRDFVVSTQAF
jgi:glycine/D-amino acid oxidase-like deaminating enzyme